jgi:excisionase family DNA binding protein
MSRPRSDREPRFLSPLGTDLFGGMIEQLSERIAQRVVARVEELLATRAAPPDAYRVDQAATALNLSVSEVRRRVASGELAARRVGRAVLIPRVAVENFLADHSSDAA